MAKPLVSVVMVIRDVDRFLPEAIESILSQTFRDFEFIIVDFGSTDNSKSIALSYAAKDSRIKLHEVPHCTLPVARNTACSLAQGKYIAIMDADDVSLPERLALEVEYMEIHPEVGVLGGSTECINAAGKLLATRIHDVPIEHHEIKSALAVRCPFCQASVLIHREAFNTVGGYREVFVQAEDYDLWLRISEHFQCAGLQHVVLRYRIHPYQISMQKQREQTICWLAAHASASLRSSGKPDALNSLHEITPALLADLGISKARQQSYLFIKCRDWVRIMCDAGEYSVALEAALVMLQSDWEYVERWKIADLHLTIAKLYWQQTRKLSSFLAIGRAVMSRPAVVGRPLKQLLRWAGLA